MGTLSHLPSSNHPGAKANQTGAPDYSQVDGDSLPTPEKYLEFPVGVRVDTIATAWVKFWALRDGWVGEGKSVSQDELRTLAEEIWEFGKANSSQDETSMATAIARLIYTSFGEAPEIDRNRFLIWPQADRFQQMERVVAVVKAGIRAKGKATLKQQKGFSDLYMICHTELGLTDLEANEIFKAANQELHEEADGHPAADEFKRIHKEE